jgi:hypothetical protein
MGGMSKAGWMFLAGPFAAFSSGVVEWRFCWVFCKMQREKRGAFVVNRGANVVICVAKLTANSALRNGTGFRDLFLNVWKKMAGWERHVLPDGPTARGAGVRTPF